MSKLFSDLKFEPNISELICDEDKGKIVILTGSNNSGKSAYLKTTVNNSSNLYVGVNRFYSFHHLGLYTKDDNEISNWYSNMQHNARHQEFQNFESSFFNCSTAISRLRNEKRKVLFDVFEDLFGIPIEVKPEDPDNEFSNRYISVDGDSLSVTSSGTRLFLGILAALMDDRFTSVAIDEPELGLSPNLQRRLADIIIRGNKKAELFPHNPNIILSTHSHIFLDKTCPGNNFIVSKNSDLISAKKCTGFSELHEIQFRLLGNDLSELFLPDAVVFVEGETDKLFLEKLFSLHMADLKIVVQQCNGDIAQRISYWSSSLGDMQLSPYKDRTFVVYDSIKQSGIDRALANAGLTKNSVVEWSGNGIEFVYPVDLLSSIFHYPISDTKEILISGDVVSVNEISYKKMILCQKICSLLEKNTKLPQELFDKLIYKIRSVTTV